MSEGWTFVFSAFVATLFGWGFVTFANDLFLILVGDTARVAGEKHGFNRPVVWVIVRTRRIALSGFRKWLYTSMALFSGGAAFVMLTAFALAADLPFMDRAVFAGALVFDVIWLARLVARYFCSNRPRPRERP